MWTMFKGTLEIITKDGPTGRGTSKTKTPTMVRGNSSTTRETSITKTSSSYLPRREISIWLKTTGLTNPVASTLQYSKRAQRLQSIVKMLAKSLDRRRASMISSSQMTISLTMRGTSRMNQRLSNQKTSLARYHSQ